ncbi:pirin family protein [Planctomicrobium sp. SH668]|uniref:pirin family protein n=1 Tax=Planctomicrobium sp. SH668 TaxID=3448126 RepID=UPI003F5B23E3
MFQIRPSASRGHLNHGWLDTYHTFSFGSYYDPAAMGFRSLRVMNEDRVAAGAGFGTHPHRDMEILTYVLEGAIAHKDSMGNGETLRPGEFQRMTAGTGITHSEFNPSSTEELHLYQIWLLPEKKGLEPSYEQKKFDDQSMRNQFRLVASRQARDGSLAVQQDVDIYLSRLTSGSSVAYDIAAGRHLWLQVLRGEIVGNGHVLSAGDGAALSDESQLEIVASEDSEVMLFDLA